MHFTIYPSFPGITVTERQHCEKVEEELQCLCTGPRMALKTLDWSNSTEMWKTSAVTFAAAGDPSCSDFV